ncbi:MAG: DNA polymerase beta superfamily protein [Bacteroidia bacterium]
MNIHFKDTSLFEALQAATLLQVEVGSCLYGLKDEHSDTDWLCIYAPAENQHFSFVRSHHQLQYKHKELHADFLFIDVFTFLHNLLNGDASLNFEVLHTKKMQHSCLSYLFEQRTHFYSYRVMKAYLGFANRDIKLFGKEKGSRNQVKKLLHIARSYHFAQAIFEGNFELTPPFLQENKQDWAKLAENPKEFERFSAAYLAEMAEKVKHYRQEVLNKTLDKQELTRYMRLEHQQDLDTWLWHFTHSPDYQAKQLKAMDMNLFYEVNEHDVVYE